MSLYLTLELLVTPRLPPKEKLSALAFCNTSQGPGIVLGLKALGRGRYHLCLLRSLESREEGDR